jgi:PHS family inorganic phosphate transporter-like MFS transporter
MDIERNLLQAFEDIRKALTTGNFKRNDVVQRVETPWSDFREYFGRYANAKVLFGTAYSWFALDVGTSISFLDDVEQTSQIALGSPSTPPLSRQRSVSVYP